MIHEVKCWPPYWKHIVTGVKTFDVRRNDRNYLVGDDLTLREWDPHSKDYTGREVTRRIVYRLPGGEFGVDKDYVVLGLSRL